MKKVFQILSNRLKNNINITILFVFTIAFITMTACCGVCSNEDLGRGNEEELVYFTASPENSEFPSIYKTNPDGTNTENLIDNGITFSATSSTGKIVFIRKNAVDGNNNLFIADYDGTNSRLITSESDIFSISYPIISPNGKYIAFNGGNSKLIYHDLNSGSVFNLFSTRLASNSIPSFSANSKYIAFIEEIGTKSYTLKVMDAENSDAANIIYSKTLGSVNFSDNIETSINWSADSKSIIFTLRNGNEDDVYIINLIDNNERIIEIQNSEIGGNNATLSPNGDYLAVAGVDGNLWLVFIATNDYKFSKITNSEGFEKNYMPKWSANGDKILYNSSSPIDVGIYSTLICVELKFTSVLANPVRSYILSNNVYRGFWNSKKENS